MKVLVVEDEAKVLKFIQKGLSNSEISVDTSTSIDELFSNLLSISYDAIVLDRLLKGVDSIRYLSEIKKKAPQAKIIVLSALSEVDDKVEGLTSGADDYLGKPFHIDELLARLRALCRRGNADQTGKDHILTFKDLTINLDNQKVERGGKRIELTAKEYKLLVYLVKKPNRVFPKTELINKVWELNYYPESNVVEVVVNHLRSKVDKGYETPLIHSKRGVGYWAGDKDV
jgi:DNA-binding response OmpR family regulator